MDALPCAEARPEYIAAFGELAHRIETSLGALPSRIRPIQMIVAGGAAMHLYTGARVSRDIDAAFSHRINLPPDLCIAYSGVDGRAETLYFDYQYNDTFALMHEDARQDAVAVKLQGVDASVLEVRLLNPIDLAVSKLSRLTEVDRGDIETLARKGLIDSTALRRRAEEALEGYLGDLTRIRGAINLACRMVEDIAHRLSPSGPT